MRCRMIVLQIVCHIMHPSAVLSRNRGRYCRMFYVFHKLHVTPSLNQKCRVTNHVQTDVDNIAFDVITLK